MRLRCLFGHDLLWPRPGRAPATRGLTVRECARCHAEVVVEDWPAARADLPGSSAGPARPAPRRRRRAARVESIAERRAK